MKTLSTIRTSMKKRKCDRCGADINRGEPIRRVRRPSEPWRKAWQCVACAIRNRQPRSV